MALSVIIPTLNSEGDLQECLARVLAGGAEQIIVSDGGSTDESLQIAEDAGAKIVTGSPGRGGQLARGAASATGEWLLFLHSDSLLPENWREIVDRHIQGDPSPAAFRLRFRSDAAMARVTAGWANLRSRIFGLPYGDQGLLISRADYAATGGYPNIALMEDVAIARALCGRIRLLPAHISTSAERYAREGWVRRGARNLWLLLRYFLGASPEGLARDYRR